VAVIVAGAWLWTLHARAWDLGGRSPVLGFDAAQYALAARELATQGRLATTYALPIELARHPLPPWPLAVVQPGLVVAEAAIERLAPRRATAVGGRQARLDRPEGRAWLSLLVPLASFLVLAALLALGAVTLLTRFAPASMPWERPPVARWEAAAAGLTVALAFLLDPESQHAATGGVTELPFTLGLIAALLALALGEASRRPLLFGLLLGLTGTFRANMLWLAPLLALGAALVPEPRPRAAGPAPGGAAAARTPAAARGDPTAPPRLRIFALAMLGFALPLLPWWLYKWRHFGSPAWDLTRLMLWEGVEGRTWFSLLHLPQEPDLPRGAEALALLAGKVAGNLPGMLLALATGPRALWIGALAVWLATRPPRTLAVAGGVVLAQAALGTLAAAATIPWLRYLLPARVPLEAAGLLASWALIARLPAASLAPPARRLAQLALALLVLGWSGWQTRRGLAEARSVSAERGLPATRTLLDFSARLQRELAPGEPVMSNLGPTLAYFAERPVLHLALAPEDVDACRARLPFRHVLLAFRAADRAWPEWQPILVQGGEVGHPGLDVADARRWRSQDGFEVVWLELEPPRPQLAMPLGSHRAASWFRSRSRPTGRVAPLGAK
jgi:hypothetical protein